jgi:hypothetical protein
MLPESELYYNYICTAVDRIFATLEGLDAEQLNWRPIEGETSSLYVLGVHIIGNLRQGVVSVLGGARDVRDRNAEFNAVAGSTEEAHLTWVVHHGLLVEQWTIASVGELWSPLKEEMQGVFARLTREQLEREYAHPRRGVVSGHELCLIMATHANEHVGHAELTRQLLDTRQGKPGAG